MNSSIGFRCCQRTDLAVCASIATEAFPLKISRSTGEEASGFMQFQIDGCHAISNYRELAVAGGEIAGLLFGRLNRKSFVIGSQTLKQLFLISVRFLLGRYGSRRKLIRIIKPGLLALRAVRRNIPAS